MAETPKDNEEANATNPGGKTENFVSKHFVRLLVWLAVSGWRSGNFWTLVTLR